MLITHEREKLINAIIFFATNTRYFGKIKLFKLLYFLDFEHFKDTGRSVTGLNYHAWKMGPVPTELFNELEAPEPDLAQALNICEVPTKYDRPMLSFKPRVDFDSSHFTKREMRLMQRLAREFEGTRAEDMIEATHLENQPWDRVWNQSEGRQERIPYELAVREQERETVLAVAQAHREVRENLR